MSSQNTLGASSSAAAMAYAPNSSSKRSIRFNLRHLLSLVRERPQIWLVSHAHYRSTKQRQKAWFQIARCLDKEFDQLEKNEQKRIVLAIIKRWKNVRDTFFHNLRSKRPRPYVYEQDLKFLLSVRTDLQRPIERNGADGSNSESDECVAAATKQQQQQHEQQQYEHEMAMADPLVKSEDEAAASMSDSDSSTISPQMNGGRSRKHYGYGSSTARLEASMRQDQSFFDSIKPTVRTLSLERKFDFRIEVMRLLKRIKARRRQAMH